MRRPERREAHIPLRSAAVYANRDLSAYQTITIHIPTAKDSGEFIKLVGPHLVGQKITARTRSIWFPKKEIERASKKCYVDESAA